MLRIRPVGGVPQELQTWIRETEKVRSQQLPPLKPIRYSEWTSEVKRAIWQKLYDEQNGRCAYCERKLPNDSTDTVIEHFHPREIAELADWSDDCTARTGVTPTQHHLLEVSMGNLLLSCNGKWSGSSTCDTAKKSNHICMDWFNSKTESGHREQVRVLPSGRVEALHYPGTARDAQHVLDDNLGLNEPALVETRRSIFAQKLHAFMAVKKGNRGRVPSARLREEHASAVREEATRAPYASTLLAVADAISRRN